MRFLLLVILFYQTIALGYVLNKGPIFQKELGYFSTQKSLLAPYYLFYHQNTFSQIEMNQEYQKQAQEVFQRNGHYLKLNTPDRFDSDMAAWKHIFSFSYKRDNPFYLNETVSINADYGFCYGFATALRKFDYLAIYRPDQKKDSLEETNKKIDKIFENKPQIFNGYENLIDMVFSNEAIEFHIRRHLVDQWAISNVRNGVIWNYIQHYFEQRDKKGEDHFLKLHQRISKFLRLGFQPLVFHFWGEKTNIHVFRVLSISQLERRDGDQYFSITLYDYTSETIVKNLNINIARWFELVPNEELEMGNMANELKNFYHSNLPNAQVLP